MCSITRDRAGTLATWYFNPEEQNASVPSAKRACTSSFGSACYGALIVATIETLEMIARYAESQARDADGDSACQLYASRMSSNLIYAVLQVPLLHGVLLSSAA